MSKGLGGLGYYILVGQTSVRVDDVLEWAQWFADTPARRVAATRIGPFWVSTVFLGIDMNYWREGPPLLFETMTFLDAPPGARDFEGMNECDGRWSTWLEAEAAHRDAVQYLQSHYCHAGEQPVEDAPVPPAVREADAQQGIVSIGRKVGRCLDCGKMFRRGPYFVRRLQRHGQSHGAAALTPERIGRVAL